MVFLKSFSAHLSYFAKKGITLFLENHSVNKPLPSFTLSGLKFRSKYFASLSYTSSGNNHHLSNSGAIMDNSPIKEGQSVNFDDSTDFLTFPSTINPFNIWSGNGISFSVWVNYTNVSLASNSIFDFNATGQSALDSVSIRRPPFVTGLRITVGGLQEDYSISNLGFNGLTGGNWIHIVFCIEINGDWRFYVNGVNQNIISNSSILNHAYDVRYINKVESTTGNFTGNIDLFKIYSKVLTQAEVSNLYNNPTATGQQQDIYNITFPEQTEVQVLLLDNSRYLETSPFLFSGIANIEVGGTPSKFETTTTTTNSTAYDSGIVSAITGANITYNAPVVIVRYIYATPIITTNTNVPFVGYLNYKLTGWEVNDIVGDTNNLIQDTNNLIQDTNNLIQDTSNFIIDTSNIITTRIDNINSATIANVFPLFYDNHFNYMDGNDVITLKNFNLCLIMNI